MKNITPRTYPYLIAIARHSFGALQKWESELALTHTTAARLLAESEAAVQTQGDYQTSCSVYHEKVQVKLATQRRAFMLLMVTRDLLRQHLGTQYSRSWDQTGFFNCTLKIPVLAHQQIFKLSTLKEFFLLNPDLEVPGVATAALAAAMHEELMQRVSDVSSAWVERRQRKKERNAALAALRQRVKQLYAELKIVLPLDDPRWFEFGFKIPGDRKRSVSTDATTGTTEAGTSVEGTLDAAAPNIAPEGGLIPT